MDAHWLAVYLILAGLAIIESLTLYALLITIILIFVNPFVGK